MQPYQHTSNFAHAGWTGWVPRTDRGLLRLTGADALGFLQALVTNDVASLSVGGACDAAWLTPQGRMITDMDVYRGEGEVLVSVAAELAASLAVRLDLLIFAEDVQVTDASSLIHQIQLVGESRAGGRDVFFDAAREGEVLAALDAAGVRAIDAAEAEALRIDAGRPRWGVDMNEETIPLEAGLLEGAARLEHREARVVHDDDGQADRRVVRGLVARHDRAGRADVLERDLEAGAHVGVGLGHAANGQDRQEGRPHEVLLAPEDGGMSAPPGV